MWTDIGWVDDVVIDASAIWIDGPGDSEGNTLGQANATAWRSRSNLPSRGFMQFDTYDLSRMSLSRLEQVIIHEMGHVLGIGSMWAIEGLLQGAGTSNPVFTGPRAMAEYAALLGVNTPTPVPIENTGGPGTQDVHWRESVFGNEILTGWIDSGTNPISRVTIASLADHGYEVNMGAADPYTLPGASLSLSLVNFSTDDDSDDDSAFSVSDPLPRSTSVPQLVTV